MHTAKLFIVILFFGFLSPALLAQKSHKPPMSVIAYFTGNAEAINRYDVKKLTHIIYSFCHLRNGKLSVDNAADSATIKHLVSLKAINPSLKVMLSLGGWGGCAPCSQAFSTKAGRKQFAQSVKQLNRYFKTDGIDLDWEYPTIPGHPGHLYQAADYHNFTHLVKLLRKALGRTHEISFAAGGFQQFLDSSVNWKAVMPLVNRVNLMSYDLVNGYATVTGHQTSLYSTKQGEESTHNAVSYLLKLGIPAHQLVIGAAFYTRIWTNVAPQNNGLYQAGKHVPGVIYSQYQQVFTPQNGWQRFWDNKAKAPFWYNASEQKFATGDDEQSIKEKTQYALNQKLGGIMFWELVLDKPKDGLLDIIDRTIYPTKE